MPYTERRNHFSEPSFDVFVPARRNDPLGIIEGVVLEGNKRFVPWIGLSSVRELALKYADKTRLVDAGQLELAQERYEATEELLAQAQARIEELEHAQERVAGLTRAGYKLVKVQGRPKAKVEN